MPIHRALIEVFINAGTDGAVSDMITEALATIPIQPTSARVGLIEWDFVEPIGPASDHDTIKLQYHAGSLYLAKHSTVPGRTGVSARIPYDEDGIARVARENGCSAEQAKTWLELGQDVYSSFGRWRIEGPGRADHSPAVMIEGAATTLEQFLDAWPRGEPFNLGHLRRGGVDPHGILERLRQLRDAGALAMNGAGADATWTMPRR